MKKQFIQKYFICFMLYSIMGWCYEVILETLVYKWGFTNRGVLFGPYCPVYGVGALIFVFSLSWLMNKKGNIWFKIVRPVLIFICCALIATAVELIASYIIEYFTGSWPWQTYENYKYNFQGRIALSPSVRFGIGGTVFLYFVQPLFNLLLSKLKSQTINIVFAVMATTLICDCIHTFVI